jgi:hypothetical protein
LTRNADAQIYGRKVPQWKWTAYFASTGVGFASGFGFFDIHHLSTEQGGISHFSVGLPSYQMTTACAIKEFRNQGF